MLSSVLTLLLQLMIVDSKKDVFDQNLELFLDPSDSCVIVFGSAEQEASFNGILPPAFLIDPKEHDLRTTSDILKMCSKVIIQNGNPELFEFLTSMAVGHSIAFTRSNLSQFQNDQFYMHFLNSVLVKKIGNSVTYWKRLTPFQQELIQVQPHSLHRSVSIT